MGAGQEVSRKAEEKAKKAAEEVSKKAEEKAEKAAQELSKKAEEKTKKAAEELYNKGKKKAQKASMVEEEGELYDKVDDDSEVTEDMSEDQGAIDHGQRRKKWNPWEKA